jgi:hypothetical protein
VLHILNYPKAWSGEKTWKESLCKEQVTTKQIAWGFYPDYKGICKVCLDIELSSDRAYKAVALDSQRGSLIGSPTLKNGGRI